MILVCAVLAVLTLGSEANSMMGFNNGQQQQMQSPLPRNVQTLYEQKYPNYKNQLYQQQAYPQYQTTTPQYSQYQTSTPQYSQPQYPQYQAPQPQYQAPQPQYSQPQNHQYQPGTSYNDEDRQKYKFYVYDQIRRMIQSKLDGVNEAPKSVEVPSTVVSVETSSTAPTEQLQLDSAFEQESALSEQTKRSGPLAKSPQFKGEQLQEKKDSPQPENILTKQLKKVIFKDNSIVQTLQAKSPFQKPLYQEFFNKDGTTQVIQFVETTTVTLQTELPQNSLGIEVAKETQEPEPQVPETQVQEVQNPATKETEAKKQVPQQFQPDHQKNTYQQPQYQTPQPQYQTPQPQYQTPQPQYQAPQPQYQAPQPQYQTPQPEYQAPQPQYQAPQTQYQAPQPQYQASQYPESQHRQVNQEQGEPMQEPLGNFGMQVPPAGLLAPPLPPHMALPKPLLFPRAAIVPYQGNYKGPRRDRFNDRYNQNSIYLSSVNRMRG